MTTGSGIYVWGAQLEARDTVTAYQPTTTQPITNYIPTLLTAPSNVARFDHNPVTGESLGLLVEEQRTNLLLYSEDYSNAAWTKTNVTVESDVIVAPDGTLTGDKLVATVATGQHGIKRVSTVTSPNSTSVYVKAGERSKFWLYAGNTGALAVLFDLVGETVSNVGASVSSYSIIGVGNGWYRCSITVNSTEIQNYLTIADDAGNIDHTGDGYSGLYVWGFQRENGAFPTSYIKTQASQVTRSADSASMTGTNFSDWYRQDEGTLYGEFNSIEPTGNSAVFYQLDDTTANNRLVQNYATVFTAITNGSVQASLNFGSSTPSTVYKIATSFAFNDFASSRNGATPITDNSGVIPLVYRLVIGNDNSTTSYLNGTIKKLSYYPQRLTNTQLQALTS
jgi:hypothetical protein